VIIDGLMVSKLERPNLLAQMKYAVPISTSSDIDLQPLANYKKLLKRPLQPSAFFMKENYKKIQVAYGK
jgi:hypothetical protein